MNIFPISQKNSGCYRVLLLEIWSKHCTWRASKVVDLPFAACQPTASIVQRAETVAGARGAHFHCSCWSTRGDETEIQSPCEQQSCQWAELLQQNINKPPGAGPGSCELGTKMSQHTIPVQCEGSEYLQGRSILEILKLVVPPPLGTTLSAVVKINHSNIAWTLFAVPCKR